MEWLHLPKGVHWMDVVTAAGVAVSLVGSLIAIWQARIARGAAESARESASSAAVQAQATVEQANLLGQQVAGEFDDRYLRDAPEYEVRILADEEWGTCSDGTDGFPQFSPMPIHQPAPIANWFKRETMEVGLINGPSEVELTIEVLQTPGVQIVGRAATSLATGGVAQFQLILPYTCSGKRLTFDLRSREIASNPLGRVWHRRLSVMV